MITFMLDLPKLAEPLQLQLEEALLKVPGAEAFALDDRSGNFSVTADKNTDALREAVLAIYGWAAEHPSVLAQMKVVCGGKERLLVKKSPNDIIYFLADC